jgi:hypothetical protein
MKMERRFLDVTIVEGLVMENARVKRLHRMMFGLFLGLVALFATEASPAQTTISPTMPLPVQDMSTVAAIQAASITPPFPVYPYAYPGNWLQGTIVLNNVAPVQMFAAPGVSLKNRWSGYVCANSSSSDQLITFFDGTTPVWFDYVKAWGRVDHNWLVPLSGSANTAVQVQTSLSGVVRCSMVGFWSVG